MLAARRRHGRVRTLHDAVSTPDPVLGLASCAVPALAESLPRHRYGRAGPQRYPALSLLALRALRGDLDTEVLAQQAQRWALPAATEISRLDKTSPTST